MSLLCYEEWMEEGKREIVRRALKTVESCGSSSPHHFYVTFRTDHPGVQLPGFMKSLYPEEMSLSIKDLFWNLVVTQDHFSIELLFDDQKHGLRVPFKALVSFIDPGGEFGLQFDWEKNRPVHNTSNVIFLDQFRNT